MSFSLRDFVATTVISVASFGCGARSGSLDDSGGPANPRVDAGVDAGVSSIDAASSAHDSADGGVARPSGTQPLWPMMGGSRARTGRTSGGTDAPLAGEWSMSLGLVEGVPSNDWAAIAIASDGTVYVGDGGGLHARAPDGTVRWEFAPPLGGCLSSPAIGDDGTIYVGCGSEAYALTPHGATKWHVDLGELVATPPALADDGTIYFDAAGRLHAFDPRGVERWSVAVAGAVRSFSAIGPSGTLYIVVWNKGVSSLVAVRPSGALAWTIPVGGIAEIFTPVVADDETIYVSATDYVAAFAPDGTKRWTSSRNTNGPPALGSDGTLYISGNGFGANVHALAPDGTEKWHATTTLESGNTSPILGANGVVYVLDQKIHAFAVDGRLLGERDTGTLAIGPAAIAGDMVYFTGVRGELHAMRAP